MCNWTFLEHDNELSVINTSCFHQSWWLIYQPGFLRRYIGDFKMSYVDNAASHGRIQRTVHKSRTMNHSLWWTHFTYLEIILAQTVWTENACIINVLTSINNNVQWCTITVFTSVKILQLVNIFDHYWMFMISPGYSS